MGNRVPIFHIRMKRRDEGAKRDNTFSLREKGYQKNLYRVRRGKNYMQKGELIKDMAVEKKGG